MATDVKIIDLRRSYVPIPPEVMPVSLHSTSPEDNPEARIPVIPYDGYNFMPTPQGYCSFFGINSKLGFDSVFNSSVPIEDPEDISQEDLEAAFILGYQLSGSPEITTMQEIYDSVPGGPGNTEADYLAFLSVATLYEAYELFHTNQPEFFPALTAESGAPAGIDDLFMIQTREYQNILVALTDVGIKTAKSGATEWEQEVTLEAPEEHREWSKCVIDNVIYVYRQAEDHVWIANEDNDYVFTQATPTGINMAGQLGIFKAGGRLGFWDSENSTGWGGLSNPIAFGDSEELSGFTIFQDIVGRIILCLQHGDGFVIYATKSVVHVRRNPGSALLFAGRSVFNNNGISYRNEVAYGDPDTTHFAFTTGGVAQVVNGVAEFIIPEIATYLKEKRQPIYLQMLNSRYLYFKFLAPEYAQGRVGFRTEVAPGAVYTFAKAVQKLTEWSEAVAAINISGSTIPEYPGYVSKASRPESILLTIEKSAASIYLNHVYGYTAYAQTEEEEAPVWRNYLTRSISAERIAAWKNYSYPTNPSYAGYAYFENLTNTDSGFDVSPLPEYPLILMPTGPGEAGAGPDVDLGSKIEYISREDASFNDAVTRLEAVGEVGYNENDFYSKQETVFDSEERFMDDWLDVVLHKFDRSDSGNQASIIDSGSVAEGVSFVSGVSSWILDRSVHSYTTTRYYGANEKSAWLQHSLARIFRIIYTVQRIKTTGDTTVRIIQQIVSKRVEYRYLNNCLFKMLGYTKIDAHGHYDEDGDLVIDNTDAEAPAHVDVCESDESLKKKNGYYFAFFFTDAPIAGTDPENEPYSIAYPISPPWETGRLLGYSIPGLTIDGEEYPPEYFIAASPADVVLPDSTIFLQDGSPAPEYPLFLGAFVFDVHYKKWGKAVTDFFHLVDLYPINNVAGEGYIPYDSFLPRVAALRDDGLIYIYDKYPEESELVIGKYGSYRKGTTTLHEVETQFREAASGSFSYEGSIDNKNLSSLFSKTYVYSNEDEFIAYAGIDAKWFNFVYRGHFDLTLLEVTSQRAGRR